MRKKLLPCGLPTEHFVLKGMVPHRSKSLVTMLTGPSEQWRKPPGLWEKDQREGIARNSKLWLKPEAKKHEQGCLQSAPGDSLGPQYSMVRPELGAASESSGVLPQHDLTSLREGQNFVSSSPSTVDDSTWLSCFKRWAVSKAVSTGFPKFC